jgi:hypothetical protein
VWGRPWKQWLNFLDDKIKLMITDYQPSRRIAWRVDVRHVTGAAGYAAGCRFESLQGGTRVFKFIEGELAGSFRLLEPIINRPLKRLEIETDLGIATVHTPVPHWIAHLESHITRGEATSWRSLAMRSAR